MHDKTATKILLTLLIRLQKALCLASPEAMGGAEAASCGKGWRVESLADLLLSAQPPSLRSPRAPGCSALPGGAKSQSGASGAACQIGALWAGEAEPTQEMPQ